MRIRSSRLRSPPALVSQSFAAVSSASVAGGSVFTLPDGWRVEEVPRRSTKRSKHVDKFYHEPGTGRKFRSLREVKKYLNPEEVQLASRSGNSRKRSVGSTSGCSRKSIIFDGKIVSYMEGMAEKELASLALSETAAKSHYDLPDGWVVEEVPQKDGTHTDKYYYEPETGQKFRSLPAAKKHVAALSEDTDLNSPLARQPLSLKNQASYMKNPTKNCEQPSLSADLPENVEQPFSFDDVPEKVEWVLEDHETNTWKAFIDGRPVPASVQKKWSEKFYQVMHKGSSSS